MVIRSFTGLYKNAYSGLTRRIWLLSLVMLINRCGTMVLAFLTLYSKKLGFTTPQAGTIVAIYGLGSVAGAFLGGKISDKFGFYYTQFFALFFGGILFILVGTMTSYESVCIAIFFLSLVNESFRPANISAIAHYSTPENRTQSFSLVRLAINLGWGVGAALGGFLASFNYHLLFWTDGLTNISAAIMLLWLLPKVSLKQQVNTVAGQKIENAISPYRDKTFLYFLGFILLFAACFFQLFTTVPLFFKEKLLLDEMAIGIIMASNGVFIALFEMIIVFKLEGRRPYLTLMSYGAMLMAISFFLLNIPLPNGFIVGMLAVCTITLAEMVAMPFMNTYYVSRSSHLNRGQYAGMYTMAWSIAQVIGSSAGALIANSLGYFNLWIIVGTVSLLAAAGYFWLQKKTSS